MVKLPKRLKPFSGKQHDVPAFVWGVRYPPGFIVGKEGPVLQFRERRGAGQRNS